MTAECYIIVSTTASQKHYNIHCTA